MKPILVMVAVCMTVVMGSPARADTAVAQGSPTLRFGGTLGINAWQDLGDLSAGAAGDFDEAGVAVELNLHGGGWPMGPARIYAGIDLGILSNGSDIEGIEEGEDLYASMLYLTPSVKAVFSGSSRMNWTLDAGIGYYDVSIDETEDDCFWDCDVYEYYDDSATGGYLGFSFEFPLGRPDRPLRWTGGAKVHFVDFDEPTFLNTSGSLDGPIYVIFFGLGFYR